MTFKFRSVVMCNALNFPLRQFYVSEERDLDSHVASANGFSTMSTYLRFRHTKRGSVTGQTRHRC